MTGPYKQLIWQAIHPKNTDCLDLWPIIHKFRSLDYLGNKSEDD